jgi:hypothetical protein
VFGWWLMKTTGKNLGETVVVGQFAWTNNELLAADDPGLDASGTNNNREMKWEAEKNKLDQMAMVQDLLEW